MPKPTYARVRELLEYDPESGVFRHRKSRGGVRAGDIAGRLLQLGYVAICLDYCLCYGHRLAWLMVHGEWPAEIDHINGNRADNRISNLRLATRTQNNANQKKRSDNTSGFKGVSFDKQKQKWVARLGCNRTICHVGYFDTPQAAHRAYLAAAKKHFGDEFVRAA